MGDRFHVRIDLARIQSNMLRDEGGKLTVSQIRNWLISAGFTPDADGPGWTADRDALRQLDRSELLESKPIRRSRNPAAQPGRRGGEDRRNPEKTRPPEISPKAAKAARKRAKR